MPLCWQWELLEYYWRKTVEGETCAAIPFLCSCVPNPNDVSSPRFAWFPAALVENCDPKLGCSYTHLKAKVPLPPPMRTVKLMSFMRKYPDIFKMEFNTR